MMDRYRIDYAVVQRRSSGTLIDLSRLFTSLDWPLAYLDGVSLVYVRPGSPAAAAVAGETFRVVTPGATDAELVARARAAPEALLAELRRVDPARLVLPSDLRSFGVAAAVAGDPTLAVAFLRAGVRGQPDSALLHMNLGTALLDAGFPEEAVREFRAAVKLGGGDPIGADARRRLADLDRAAPPGPQPPR
jgi:hypothetical protein